MVFQKTIEQLVNENYVYARALHYLGIDFFKSPHKKLKVICKERRLDRTQVIKSFYLFDSCHRLSFSELGKYPIELLTEYLKHAHHFFIKDKLPYIIHLAKTWDRVDLKDLLAEFIEDFIKHIYEEEDSTFKCVDLLCEIKKGSTSAAFKWFKHYEKHSLTREFEEHQQEDAFGAIHWLMSSFQAQNLHDRVLLSEIQAFGREMIYHAEIENNIFFPKAIKLEEEVGNKIRTLITLN